MATIGSSDASKWIASNDGRNFVGSLYCPVFSKLLKKAVVLTPCGHTISELAAIKIYKGKVSEQTVRKEAPCPLCRRTVKAYYPNHAVRILVASLAGQRFQDVLPTICAKVIADSEMGLDTIPFSGRGANFILADGDWKEYAPWGFLNKHLTFVSKTRDSSFKRVKLLGYTTGAIRVSVDFNKNGSIVNYLSDCGIEIDPFYASAGYYQSNKDTTSLLLRILIGHNQFPEEYIGLMRDAILSQSGDDRKDMS